jgi:beta-lactamase superfamily II metal-dependent hydrolase
MPRLSRFLRPLSILIALATTATLHAQTRNLEIYWIDVEGGGSTLIVTPSGKSLLVDTGFPGDRDARRIQQTAKAAGLSQIDILLITHYHGDHVGGAPGLAQLIPIKKFYDHGDSVEANAAVGALLYDGYKTMSAGKRVIAKPGDKIPLQGVDITVVSSNGDVIEKPLKDGGAANDLCKDAAQKGPDTSENARSVGFLLTYGKFKFLDLGDLTWQKEMMLACPENKLGTVTVFQATHHGFSGGASGPPALVWALKPQVVVVNDGARKGFDGNAFEILNKIPGVDSIWQIHRAVQSDVAHNTAEHMIANMEEGPGDQGLGINISVAKDGSFTVRNMRNNFTKTYTAR